MDFTQYVLLTFNFIFNMLKIIINILIIITLRNGMRTEYDQLKSLEDHIDIAQIDIQQYKNQF